MKKKSSKDRKVTKGTPTAVLISILIHAALFFLAGVFVVFTVVKQKEVEFTPPKAVERPKMKLKKPKVKVKKSSKPKPTTRIVTKVQKASMPDIQLPEMSGMSEGLGDGNIGFDLMPDLEETTIFGSGQTIGNDFVGTFYDYKRDRKGRPIPFSGPEYQVAARRFLRSGWKESSLARYYRSPKKRYATCFVIPPMISALVPGIFGEPDTDGGYWATLYKGQLVHKDGITFRFVANGNGTMAIRVDGKLVLVSGWLQTEGEFWQSSSADDRKYFLGDNWATVGDWITLEPGVPHDMEVFMTDGGGVGCFMVAIQEKGAKYPMRTMGGGPTFPAFKTAEPSHDLLDVIYRDLVPGEVDLTNGPVFCDYAPSPAKKSRTHAAASPEPVIAVPSWKPEPPVLRTWALPDGKSLKAKYIVVIGKNVVLKTARGKQVKLPLARLSPADREYVELVRPPIFKIDFGKKMDRIISIDASAYASSSRSPEYKTGYKYRAKVRLKQTSAGKYNHSLKVELFAIGREIIPYGNRYILLDRQTGSFSPAEENGAYELEGKTIDLPDYLIEDEHKRGQEHRGQAPYGYLVTVTDERGKIVQHKASNEWLFEHLDNLRKLPVGAYMDKNGIRTFPTSPKRLWY